MVEYWFNYFLNIIHNMAFPTKLSQLCTPSYVYFIMSVLMIVISAVQNMGNSYKEMLKQQIQELENNIEQSFEKKEELQAKLSKLRIAEFEEDMREDSSQQLLKG